MGRPFMWSGQAPMVKLGEVLRFDCCCWRFWWSRRAEFGVTDEVIGEDVFDDVDEAFDSVWCWPKPPLIGDFKVSGEFIWLIFKNSQFLQSISLRFGASVCSGHVRRWFCICCCWCCCCARSSFSVLCCSRRLVSCERSADEFRNLKSPPAKRCRTFSPGGCVGDKRPVSDDKDFGVNLGWWSSWASLLISALSADDDTSIIPSSFSVPSWLLLLLLLLSLLSLTLSFKLLLLISNGDGWFIIIVVVEALAEAAAAASSGSRNDICEFSSVFFWMMAEEYSRHNSIFSESLRLSLCSVLAWDENNLVLPKLNLQMKHMRIGFCCLCWLFSCFLSTFSLSPCCCCSSDGVVHGEGSSDGAVDTDAAFDDDWVDDEFIVASRDEMTRNEWIFGLFDCDTSAIKGIIVVGALVECPKLFVYFRILPLILLSDNCIDSSFSESIMYALPSRLYTTLPWNRSTSAYDVGEASSESYSCE